MPSQIGPLSNTCITFLPEAAFYTEGGFEALMPTVVGQTSALLVVPTKPFTCKFLLAMTGFSPAPGSINRIKEEKDGWNGKGTKAQTPQSLGETQPRKYSGWQMRQINWGAKDEESR